MATNPEIGGAMDRSETNFVAPRRKHLRVVDVQPQAKIGPLPILSPPAAEIHGATGITKTNIQPPHETELIGRLQGDDHLSPASQTLLPGQRSLDSQKLDAGQTLSGQGQMRNESQLEVALVGNISIERRRYEDLCRAHQRLLLQCISSCRYACDGDKEKGAKLYADVAADPQHPMAMWLMPYHEAMAPLEVAKRQQEKVIAKLGRQLPVWGWAREVLGLSDRFLALIVGECGIGPGEYRSVSALWKRMGMAVIDGGRQRRVVGDAAVEHGYVARRRSLMWNVGNSLIKAQIRKDPYDEEKRIALGYYGQVYLDRKGYELANGHTLILSHNRAKRYMEKRLLRELWQQWRSGVGEGK